ncbi:hypothetical protein Q3G72_007653 [Acer saccharum]|nr:hypothetical protein Q3G72_007653 [Acer saccharum]
MTFFKATLLSSISHSRASIPRNGVSSLSKLFTTSHPDSKSNYSVVTETDRARLREFLHGKCKPGIIDPHEAFYFFDYMIHMQPTPPMSSFGILLTALVKNKHYSDVISLQTRMNSVGIIDGLCKDGFTDKAKELFSEMKENGILADAVTYTSLIHGLCCVGEWEEAKCLFIEMLNQVVHPTIVTFSMLLDELCKTGEMDEANKLYTLMIKRGVQPDIYTYSILMDGYCLVGRIHDVEKLFVSMASKGVYT